MSRLALMMRRLTLTGLSLLFLCAADLAARAADDYVIPPEKKNHWAWKSPVRPLIPNAKNKSWAKNPLDALILARIEAAGLQPAPPARREQLIRRVTFDLIGLPPTPGEIDAFVNDQSPDAWEKVIERLLASPHYGERWGRHWLDVARFAESNGYEFDEARPDAWRYRDYVIQSFNDDKPYDRFIREQIAGDLLYSRPSPSHQEEREGVDALIATGFNLLGPDMTDASDQKQRRQNTLNDMTDTVGLAFLGITMACARCHDHKFEPIPQRDYYRLQAFFASAVFRRDLVIASPAQRAAHAAATNAYDVLVAPTRQRLATLTGPYQQRLFNGKLSRLSDDAQVAHRTPEAQRTATQQVIVAETQRLVVVTPPEIVAAMNEADRAKHKALQDDLRKFDSKKPAPLPVTMGFAAAGKSGAKTFVLERGELGNPGEEVRAGFPIVVSVKNDRPTTDSRIALADWIASNDNPLTARVMVNRLWQHHFGRGIVPTPSDFGVRGERPSDPELLDWLATEFVAGGWRMKRMHKLMLMSATYRMSGESRRVENDAVPSVEKRPASGISSLVTRHSPLRLEGEIIRDSLLTVSGRLNRKLGGPGVFPPIPAEALQGFQGWTVSADPQDHVRRSIYIFARRNLRFPFLEAFDLPDSNLSCPKREQSTTAPQALSLLNSSDVVEAANATAARLTREAKTTDERITLAYRLALGRRPAATELKDSRQFLADSPLSELCRALFNVNEFVYVD